VIALAEERYVSAVLFDNLLAGERMGLTMRLPVFRDG
jgi:hypothetical protein